MIKSLQRMNSVEKNNLAKRDQDSGYLGEPLLPPKIESNRVYLAVPFLFNAPTDGLPQRKGLTREYWKSYFVQNYDIRDDLHPTHTFFRDIALAGLTIDPNYLFIEEIKGLYREPTKVVDFDFLIDTDQLRVTTSDERGYDLRMLRYRIDDSRALVELHSLNTPIRNPDAIDIWGITDVRDRRSSEIFLRLTIVAPKTT